MGVTEVKKVKFQTTSNDLSSSVNMFTLDKQLKISLIPSSFQLWLWVKGQYFCACVLVSACRHKIPSNCLCFTGNGAGVHIYVIDTGTVSWHNEFKGRFSNQGFDALGRGVGEVYIFLVIYLTKTKKQDSTNLMWRTQ